VTWRGRQHLVGAYRLEHESHWHELALDLHLVVDSLPRGVAVTGTLNAPGWFPLESVAGWIRWGRRPPCCHYQMNFANHRFEACLALDLTNPVFSITRVLGAIRGIDEPVRRVELRWDLRHEAIAFLRSWRWEPDAGILEVGGTFR
jgi:hypothetical protein